ncbi:DMT family transporter [Shewanella sp. Scap07]|uniref:DMT family transporter n=1 Tax=Shewanella sp. Scap07 TaxID=2589987 RepID=UPI0015BF56A3|nr:DMT family transporter [Shewanella sp. Scap07]QLE83917.1 DMT family transporter [Shewanella sp. Scap07]
MKTPVAIALLILIVGNLFSALYDVTVKLLPDEANAATFLLIRQATSVLMLLPIWWYYGRPKTAYLKLHMLRGSSGAIGGLFLVMGLMSLPLATVSTLFFTAPIWIILLGWWLLDERISGLKIVITLLGFVGVLIILRPSEMNVFGIVVIVAALIFSANQLALRKVSTNEPVCVTLLAFNLFAVPVLFVVALYQGMQGISWPVLWIALLSNVVLLVYHWLCVLAYRRAQASDIAVAEYSGLLFCVFFGWLWFDEWLDALSWLGVMLVVLPSLLLPATLRHIRRASSNKAVALSGDNS